VSCILFSIYNRIYLQVRSCICTTLFSNRGADKGSGRGGGGRKALLALLFIRGIGGSGSECVDDIIVETTSEIGGGGERIFAELFRCGCDTFASGIR